MSPVTVRRRPTRRLTSALVREVAGLIAALCAERPLSKKAGRVRIELEQRVMQLLSGPGLPAVSSLIKALNRAGRSFVAGDRRSGHRAWTERLDEERELSLHVTRNRLFRVVLVSYRSLPKLHLTPRQREIHRIQQAFYARYTAAGNVAYREPPGRLARDDRTILLIGELEADVNNGGFAQYLDNKGRRRAKSALDALESVGARKTAAMLARALRPGATEAVLSTLDDRFCKGPEDLAVLTMRHLGAD